MKSSSKNSTAVAAMDYQHTNCTLEAIKLVNSSMKKHVSNGYLIMIINFVTINKWFYSQEQKFSILEYLSILGVHDRDY